MNNPKLLRFEPGMVLAESSDGSVWNKLIVWFTGSRWTHVALVVDGITLIESTFPSGVRQVSLLTRMGEMTATGRTWALLEMPNQSGPERRAVVEAAKKYMGRRYDFLQCILLGLFGRFVSDGPLRVICSRLIAGANADCGRNIFAGVALPSTISQARRDGMAKGYCVPADIVERSDFRIVAASDPSLIQMRSRAA